MYRLMLYFLLVLFVVNISLSFVGILPYNSLDILLSGIYLVAICNLANYFLSKVVKARTNFESASISALIITLIIGPLPFFQNVFTLTLIGILAMASKYVFSFRKRHLFNPTAAAIFISALTLKIGASWWVGNFYTLPFIFIGGILVLMKIKRVELVASFLSIYFLTALLGRGSIVPIFFSPPIWFFVFVMLVEPLTSPTSKNLQVAFGVFVALFYFGLQKILPHFPYGLETSLLAGNLFSHFISPSFNVVLGFVKKEKKSKDIWTFYFKPMSKFNFMPGQYLEWTYPHKNPDSRGVRRYFTISSSPNEENITLTIKTFEKGSSFKNALLNMRGDDEIVASSPQGDFILPKDKTVPLCFIAGGIGVTPFRSITKYILEENEKRDIIFLYSNSTEEDVAFEEIFEKANNIGVKTVYIITKKDGYINEEMIKEKVPDYKNRVFYISGPEPMVMAFKKMLSGMDVEEIKTDFFPGYTDTH